MINNAKLTSIEINTADPADHSIIWLHGLGANGNDFAPIVPQLRIPPRLKIHFAFPHAPSMPVSINQGYVMPAWFDIYESDLASRADIAGMQRSVLQINTLIQDEIKQGISPANIILAGFSQGAVIALLTGLQFPEKLGGVIALSGLLPHADTVLKSAAKANRSLPIFIAHGIDDQVVPCSLGRSAYESLTNANYPVEWHTYPMAHSVCNIEIDDISVWIQKIWK